MMVKFRVNHGDLGFVTFFAFHRGSFASDCLGFKEVMFSVYLFRIPQGLVGIGWSSQHEPGKNIADVRILPSPLILRNLVWRLGSGFRIWEFGFRAQDFGGFRVLGSGFWVQSSVYGSRMCG